MTNEFGFLPYLLDGLVLAVLLFCGIQSFRKGFLMATLSFLPYLLASLMTIALTPYTATFLRGTALYGTLSDAIADKVTIGSTLTDSINAGSREIIESLQLPSFLKESLLANHNSVTYEVLDVSGIDGYISGFLANICINIISVVLTVLVVFVAGKFVLAALHIISEMPILSTFNRSLGFGVGLLKGTVVLWVIFTIMVYLRCWEKLPQVVDAMEETKIAHYFYENNMLLNVVLKIFT